MILNNSLAGGHVVDNSNHILIFAQNKQIMRKGKNGKLSLVELISLAVGTMIGASIFSIFGVGAEIAGKNLPVAFILSGLYAFVVAYSYGKLGSKIISNAGPIAFIMRGVGNNVFTGAMSILMWLTYVVSVALFANGFAGYFLPLFHLPVNTFSTGMTMVLLIVFFTALNFFGSKAVGKAEFWIVLIKLSILGLFIVAGFVSLKFSNVTPHFDKEGWNGILHASVIFFLSYMGFGLITNASENVDRPEKNIPKAIYISISIVIFIYVSVSLVAIGNLSLKEIVKAEDNALALAAEPFFGSFGFILISVGALFSISSAMNATIYGGANIAYSLAKDGELPEIFERKVWFKSPEGLYITSGLSILFALLFNIGQIASITSSIFTIIYIFVIYSHYKLVDKVGGRKIVIITNLMIISAVFVALLFYQYETQPSAFWGSVITISGALVLDAVYKKMTSRTFKKRDGAERY